MLNMASRKVPTLFYDSKPLKVSAYIKEKTFYISPGLVLVGGNYFFFEGGDGELLDPPCLIGFKAKGTFSKKIEIEIETVDNCIEGLTPIEEDFPECENGHSASYIARPEPESLDIQIACEPMIDGPTPVDGYFFKPIAIFTEETFIQYTYGPLTFFPKNITDETGNTDECSDKLFEFLL
jgi:hypothetical protein